MIQSIMLWGIRYCFPKCRDWQIYENYARCILQWMRIRNDALVTQALISQHVREVVVCPNHCNQGVAWTAHQCGRGGKSDMVLIWNEMYDKYWKPVDPVNNKSLNFNSCLPLVVSHWHRMTRLFHRFFVNRLKRVVTKFRKETVRKLAISCNRSVRVYLWRRRYWRMEHVHYMHSEYWSLVLSWSSQLLRLQTKQVNNDRPKFCRQLVLSMDLAMIHLLSWWQAGLAGQIGGLRKQLVSVSACAYYIWPCFSLWEEDDSDLILNLVCRWLGLSVAVEPDCFS